MNVEQAYGEDSEMLIPINPGSVPAKIAATPRPEQNRGQPTIISMQQQPKNQCKSAVSTPSQEEKKQQRDTRFSKMQEIDQQQISPKERENKRLLLELDYQQQLNEGLREWIHELHKKIESLLLN